MYEHGDIYDDRNDSDSRDRAVRSGGNRCDLGLGFYFTEQICGKV